MLFFPHKTYDKFPFIWNGLHVSMNISHSYMKVTQQSYNDSLKRTASPKPAVPQLRMVMLADCGKMDA